MIDGYLHFPSLIDVEPWVSIWLLWFHLFLWING